MVHEPLEAQSLEITKLREAAQGYTTAAQGCAGLHRGVQGCTGLHRAAQGCTGLRSAAQGCAGLHYNPPESSESFRQEKTDSRLRVSYHFLVEADSQNGDVLRGPGWGRGPQEKTGPWIF